MNRATAVSLLFTEHPELSSDVLHATPAASDREVGAEGPQKLSGRHIFLQEFFRQLHSSHGTLSAGLNFKQETFCPHGEQWHRMPEARRLEYGMGSCPICTSSGPLKRAREEKRHRRQANFCSPTVCCRPVTWRVCPARCSILGIARLLPSDNNSDRQRTSQCDVHMAVGRVATPPWAKAICRCSRCFRKSVPRVAAGRPTILSSTLCEVRAW